MDKRISNRAENALAYFSLSKQFLIPALKSWQELQIKLYLCDVTPACEDN